MAKKISQRAQARQEQLTIDRINRESAERAERARQGRREIGKTPNEIMAQYRRISNQERIRAGMTPVEFQEANGTPRSRQALEIAREYVRQMANANGYSLSNTGALEMLREQGNRRVPRSVYINASTRNNNVAQAAGAARRASGKG